MYLKEEEKKVAADRQELYSFIISTESCGFQGKKEQSKLQLQKDKFSDSYGAEQRNSD
jgi:hypothetical protein